MTEDERLALLARLERIEAKMDQVIEFKDMVLQFATANMGKKLGMMTKAKFSKD